MREIEVKMKVKNAEALVKRLEQEGCLLSKPIRQHDAIYTKTGSTEEWEVSKVGQICMRVRREDDKAEFNMKQQRSSESDNMEYESEVSDPDAIHQILAILGYAPQVEVKKVRRKGKYKGYEICIDEVEGLGSYAELEKLTDDQADPLKVQEELLKEFEALGLSRNDQELRGYDTQIYQLRRAG